jgi:hypothetical protein
VLQSHVRAALQSNKEAAALLDKHTYASAKLQAAKSIATTKEEEHSKLTEAAATGQKLLDSPPPTTVLRAMPLSDADCLKTLSLSQLLDYTPNDTKVRSYLDSASHLHAAGGLFIHLEAPT